MAEASLDIAEQVARVLRSQDETRKFVSEQRKLMAEEAVLNAEAAKLIREELKLGAGTANCPCGR
ncbi:hypothetical protein [uncultured Methylobacterium sp.]|jgi:cell division protein FtsL|uniref:hypothetical protein n=1 Tax=uncultured Methylobacterium sp. TaxID=157278 RepID=UPI00260FA081|nr:hypothetical protein [uncultured Methylobacterium sp.]